MDGTDKMENGLTGPDGNKDRADADINKLPESPDAAGVAPEPAKDGAAGEAGKTEIPAAGPKPKRLRFAAARCAAAAVLAAAILLLTNFGAFHMMSGGRGLSAANIVKNRYLTFNVDTIIDFVAEDYAKGGDTATGRYAIVPVSGGLAIVHLPERYLTAGDTIANQTYNELVSGTAADKYFVVSGTVKAVPADAAEKYADWYKTNSLNLYQYGLITKLGQDTISYMVDVDSTGLFGYTACTVLSCASALLLMYAIWELVRILMGKYRDEITVEVYEYDPAPDGAGEESAESAEIPEASAGTGKQDAAGDEARSSDTDTKAEDTDNV